MVHKLKRLKERLRREKHSAFDVEGYCHYNINLQLLGACQVLRHTRGWEGLLISVRRGGWVGGLFVECDVTF